MTSRKELFEIFDEITEKAFQIMEGKNSDYASDEDSLANFRSSEVLNVDPRKALLIRMLDKIKRQVNYIERGELSVDSAEDDIIDLINYSVLLHALNREKENKMREECLDEMTQIAQEMGEYDIDNVPSFCDTPDACYYNGCMCDFFDRQDATEINEYDPKNWGIDELKDYISREKATEEYDVDEKPNTKEYILLENIDGFGKEGDTFIAPPHYKTWEYVDEDNKCHPIDLENDDRIQQINKCNCKTKDAVGIKHGTENLYGELADKNNLIQVGNNVWKKEGDNSDLLWKLTKAGFQPLHETGRSMGI